MLQEIEQIYKPVGSTPLESIKEFRKGKDFRKVAACGRLDPMAHGYLLLAFDSGLKKMEELNKKDKNYTVKVLIGVSTDSTDRLGVINNKMSGRFGEIVINCIRNYKKTYRQDFHIYSSIMVKHPKTGKRTPYWKLTRENLAPDAIPSKEVTIYSVDNFILELLTLDKLKKCVYEDGLNLVTSSGNFELENVKKSWELYFSEIDHHSLFEVVTFTVTVSSGTYIRQLVKDVSIELGVPLVVLDLYRHKFFE